MADEPARAQYRAFDPDDDEERLRRLSAVLDLDEETCAMVLHMRQQIIELQNQVDALQSQLQYHHRRRQARLARYRLETFEATLWE